MQGELKRRLKKKTVPSQYLADQRATEEAGLKKYLCWLPLALMLCIF